MDSNEYLISWWQPRIEAENLKILDKDYDWNTKITKIVFDKLNTDSNWFDFVNGSSYRIYQLENNNSPFVYFLKDTSQTTNVANFEKITEEDFARYERDEAYVDYCKHIPDSNEQFYLKMLTIYLNNDEIAEKIGNRIVERVHFNKLNDTRNLMNELVRRVQKKQKMVLKTDGKASGIEHGAHYNEIDIDKLSADKIFDYLCKIIENITAYGSDNYAANKYDAKNEICKETKIFYENLVILMSKKFYQRLLEKSNIQWLMSGTDDNDNVSEEAKIRKIYGVRFIVDEYKILPDNIELIVMGNGKWSPLAYTPIKHGEIFDVSFGGLLKILFKENRHIIKHVITKMDDFAVVVASKKRKW